MKQLLKIVFGFFYLVSLNCFAQNVGINTTGAAPAATNLLEVLQPSTTASSVGIYSAHSGAITGTGYGIWVEKTGASTTNVAAYFSASGATNNSAIVVPSGGGNVSIGTTNTSAKLVIQEDAVNDAEPEIRIRGTANGNLSIHHSLSTGAVNSIVRAGDKGIFFHNGSIQTGNLVIAPWYAGTGGIRMDSIGRVGMGDPSPDHTLDVTGNIGMDAGGYLNYGDTDGITGYGIRDNGGTIEYKNSGGAWTSFSGASGWLLTGNTGTVDGTHFIGTTDDKPFNIRVNNQKSGRIESTNGNVFFGYQAGNTATGSDNIGIGQSALNQASNGGNIAIGAWTMGANTTGTSNTAIGNGALASNVSTSGNVAIGANAALYNTGGENVIIGYLSGAKAAANLDHVVAIGNRAMNQSTTGDYNVAVGPYAGDYQDGGHNVFVGYFAGRGTAAGSANYNTGVGDEALRNIGNGGDNNTALGWYAGNAITSGDYNITIGDQAGDNITTGGSNIVIGHNIDAPVGTSSNQMSIGNLIFGTGADGTGTSISSGSVGIGINAPASKLHVAGAARLGVASTTNGSLLFNNSTNANTVTLNTGVTSSTYGLTLPTSQGAANTTLVNDGSGNLSWSTSLSSNASAFTQTANAALNNSTTETSIVGTGTGSTTIAANRLSVGTSVRITVKGYSRNFSGGTLTLRVKLGGTTIMTSNAINYWTNTSDAGFSIDALITCRTTGASGSVIGQGIYSSVPQAGVGPNSDAAHGVLTSTAATTINTTAAQAIDVTAQFSVAHAFNHITVTNLIVEFFN